MDIDSLWIYNTFAGNISDKFHMKVNNFSKITYSATCLRQKQHSQNLKLYASPAAGVDWWTGANN